MPEALQFFMALMATLTSASVDVLLLISRTSSSGKGLGGSSGSRWLSNSSKCCTLLAAHLRSLFKALAFLSLTWAYWLVLLPQIH